MPLEGSPPQAAVPPSSRLRRRLRRRTWCRLSIPRSCFGPPREDKESPNWFPWFSPRKVKRSLSVRGGRCAVASELEIEMELELKKKEKEDRGKEGEGSGREIPTIIVESVRPTFLQGLFTKGGRELRKTNKHKTQARRSISSDEENRSEIVVLPGPLSPPPPPPPSNHPTVGPLHSSPCRRENNQLNGKFQYESCSTAGRSPHSPCNEKARNYSKKKQESSLAGFLIAMMMLLMLAVGGRMFAMICTSAFLYLSTYFNKGPTVESDGANNIVKGNKHATVAVDYESEEYRKKVLMDGMLKRDGRRLVS